MTISRPRLVLITWLIFVAVLLAACSLGEVHGDIGDQELLQSHDLPAGYLLVGRYTPYQDGGTALCFHDFKACVFLDAEAELAPGPNFPGVE